MFDSEVDLTILDVKSEFSSWDFLPEGVILSDSDEILAYFEELLELVIKREKKLRNCQHAMILLVQLCEFR